MPRSPSFSLSVAVLAALLASGCGLRPTGPRATEITFWAMGREGEVVRELMPAFEREHPGIRVRVQQIPWGAAHEKLITAYVGESTPDLSQVGNTWIPEFVALGALDPLTPRLGGAVPQASYFPGIWATNVVDGQVYGIPWYVDTRLVFYRKDLLARAGVAAYPTTWAGWKAAMRAVQRAGEPAGGAGRPLGGAGRYAMFLPLNEWNLPVILGLQNGADLVRDGGRRGNFQSPAFREAFRFYLSFFREGLAPRAPGSFVTSFYPEFARGTFSNYVTGPWNLGEFRTRLPDSVQNAWATAPMPGPTGPGASLAGGASLVLFRSARHKPEAWALLEYLSRPAVQAEFYRLTGSLPARRETWRDTALTNDPNVRAFGEQLERAVPTPPIPEWERIATEIENYAEAVVLGAMTEDEALRRLDADVDGLLEKRRYLLDRNARRPAPP